MRLVEFSLGNNFFCRKSDFDHSQALHITATQLWLHFLKTKLPRLKQREAVYFQSVLQSLHAVHSRRGEGSWVRGTNNNPPQSKAVNTVSCEKSADVGWNTLRERRTFKISTMNFKIKTTFADFNFHSCSAKWFHIVWNRNQEFSGLLCLPLDCPTFSEVLLSPSLLLFHLEHWLLCFIWSKLRQDSHFLSWFCYLILILSWFLKFW